MNVGIRFEGHYCQRSEDDDEVGDFGDEIINRRYSPQSCQSYIIAFGFVKRN